jgi:hypothetical protein
MEQISIYDVSCYTSPPDPLSKYQLLSRVVILLFGEGVKERKRGLRPS